MVGARRPRPRPPRRWPTPTPRWPRPRRRIDDLIDQSDAVVIEAFLNPPTRTPRDAERRLRWPTPPSGSRSWTARATPNADVLNRLAAPERPGLRPRPTSPGGGRRRGAGRRGPGRRRPGRAPSRTSRSSCSPSRTGSTPTWPRPRPWTDLDPEAAQACGRPEGEIAGEIADIASAREQEALEEAYREALAEAAERPRPRRRRRTAARRPAAPRSAPPAASWPPSPARAAGRSRSTARWPATSRRCSPPRPPTG